MDNYTEQILPIKPTSKEYTLFAGAITLAMIGLALMVLMNIGIGFLLLLLGCVASYFAKRGLDYEYEYIFTNGDFEVAKIISKSSRKNVCEVGEENVQRILQYNSDKFQNELDINTKMSVKDYTTKEPDNSYRWYAFMMNEKNKTTAVVLELDDKNQEYIKRIFKNKIEK
ncbi:MAG: hypothetical protein IJV15_09580 [Lachnospiraceae bacterium]|nr:hypothetical protein [Lachnospiraceae bacterium]